MACYRLAFESHQVFEVVIDGQKVARDYEAEACVGTIYRVTNGAREIDPLHRQTGGPLEVYAVSEDMTLFIAKYVLREVTGSDLVSVGKCGEPEGLPMFRPI